MEKECRICHQMKTLEDFPKRKEAFDGRRTECKACIKVLSKNHPSKKPEKRKVYSRRYYLKYPKKFKEIAKTKYAKNKENNPQKLRDDYKKWYDKNKDKAKAATDAWLAKNPHWKAEYEFKNKDIIKEKRKIWRQNNPSLVREKTRRYQARRRGATPNWLSAIQMAQIQEFYDVAVALEMQTGVPHDVDHIHPLNGKNFSGLHVPWNLQVLTEKENMVKGNRLEGDMLW